MENVTGGLTRNDKKTRFAIASENDDANASVIASRHLETTTPYVRYKNFFNNVSHEQKVNVDKQNYTKCIIQPQ